MLTIRISLLLVAVTSLGLAADQPNDATLLFNGKNLEGFDTFLRDKGLNNDPDQVFRVHDGLVHVSGTELRFWNHNLAGKVILQIRSAMLCF
jgi:hypothetical protein